MKGGINRSVPNTQKDTDKTENSKIEFIAHYAALIRSGKYHPRDLQAIIDSYEGPKDEFAENLYFTAFLEDVFRKAGRKTEKYLGPDNLKRAKAHFLEILSYRPKDKNVQTP